MRLAPTLLLLVTIPVLSSAPAEARSKRGPLSGAIEKKFSGTLWALRDLPAYTGMTLGFPWVGPLAEVSASGWKIDATTQTSVSYGSAKTLWWGVRPYEILVVKEVEYDAGNGHYSLALVGVEGSKGHDTKIRITGDPKSLAEIEPALDQLLSDEDPLVTNADWSEEVKRAIRNRVVINGMTKRQAYLVVGEPMEATTRDEGGKKIETWKPRQSNGMRIGYSGGSSGTGYPGELRFEDGKLVGLATGAGGGVSLD
jgi:hypothetical protein